MESFCIYTYDFRLIVTMTYSPHKLNLTDKQKQLLSSAIQSKTSVTLRLRYEQLQGGADTLGLTQTQINRIEKHKAEKKGVQISLFPCQLTKQGGFLGPLLLNVAKAVLSKLGISALEGATSALVNKAISGTGCDCNAYAKKAVPHFLKNLTPEQRQRAENELKQGGFILPLLATAISSLLPTMISAITGKGYQVRPPVARGAGYQVRPPKNYFPTL